MPIFWHFKSQNWHPTFMKWTPGSMLKPSGTIKVLKSAPIIFGGIFCLNASIIFTRMTFSWGFYCVLNF